MINSNDGSAKTNSQACNAPFLKDFIFLSVKDQSKFPRPLIGYLGLFHKSSGALPTHIIALIPKLPAHPAGTVTASFLFMYLSHL